MIQVNASVKIYRPISRVFEFISNAENDFQWQYGTLESAQVSAGSVGVGAFFQSVGHIQGHRFLGTFEITEYEANKSYGFKSLSGPVQSQTLYTFEAAPGSTRVSISTQVRATDAFEGQGKNVREATEEATEREPGLAQRRFRNKMIVAASRLEARFPRA